jgi:hypothetical protein
MDRDALTRRNAWDLVKRLMTDPRVDCVTEPDGLVPIWVSFSKRDDRSHLLWTDDYLAAFAHAANVAGNSRTGQQLVESGAARNITRRRRDPILRYEVTDPALECCKSHWRIVAART